MQRRRSVGVLLAVLAAGLFFTLIDQPWFPGCLFHRVTGLHCPGCGMTRAVDAVFHGRIAEGFRFHAVGLIVLGLAVLFVAMRLPAWLRGASGPVLPQIRGQAMAWIVGGLLVFWVLRNIPCWPFTLLAPP